MARLHCKQRLNGAALVHRTIAFCNLIQRKSQIENLAGVDLPLPDQVNEFGQEAAYGRGAAECVDFGKKTFRCRESES
jgi:hypothetical protein